MATNLTIEGAPFACVRLAEADFADVAAVYVVICVASGGSWKALDVGQSGSVGSRIDAHDRKDCWRRNCPSGNIWVCVHRMPSSSTQQREELERSLRRSLNPPCGDR